MTDHNHKQAPPFLPGDAVRFVGNDADRFYMKDTLYLVQCMQFFEGEWRIETVGRPFKPSHSFALVDREKAAARNFGPMRIGS